MLMVAADTLGIPLEVIHLQIGDTNHPPSGGSGASSTIGGVCAATRRAAIDAREGIFAKVASSLNARPDELECMDGMVRMQGDSTRSVSWKEACSKLGAMPLTLRGKSQDKKQATRSDQQWCRWRADGGSGSRH